MKHNMFKSSKLSQIGKLAPNFFTVAVYRDRLGKVRLSDYRGKKYVLLLFYPANFTSISSNELVILNRYIKQFKKLSTQILAISIDSPFSHLQFLRLSRLKRRIAFLEYPLVSDLTHKIIYDYSVISNDGICFPALFLVDKEGVIQYYNVNNLLCSRNVSEILRILRAVQFIKENPGKTYSIRLRN